MTDPIAAAWARWVHNAEPGVDAQDAFRAGWESALSALPRMQPSEAEVERAARAMAELSCKYPDPMKRHAWADVYWPAYSEYSRAALATLPALPSPDAAALRAEGFAAGVSVGFDAGFGVSAEGWNGEIENEYCDDAYYRERKADAIAALKPGDGK